MTSPQAVQKRPALAILAHSPASSGQKYLIPPSDKYTAIRHPGLIFFPKKIPPRPEVPWPRC